MAIWMKNKIHKHIKIKEGSEMTENEKLALLEETMELDEGTLTEKMLLEDIEEYDSMAKLSLIVMMEDEFGVKLDSDTVRGFKTVEDILKKMED